MVSGSVRPHLASSLTLLPLVALALGVSVSPAGAQTISDNDCTISLTPPTLSIPRYGGQPVSGTSSEIMIFTATFATQGCSCVEAGDQGFDNPDEIKLVTPAGSELAPFRFNDIDGYAQFEYTLSQAVLDAGGGVFRVKMFDSCGGQDVLVDEADFDIDFDIVDVPDPPEPPPAPGVAEACASTATGALRLVGAGVECRPAETRIQLLIPSAEGQAAVAAITRGLAESGAGVVPGDRRGPQP